ncbi:MAG: hypothetical protein HY096_00660 [Nitrospinae bacterium]|nr:hypothetical protein [Nitrospinota bacterium]
MYVDILEILMSIAPYIVKKFWSPEVKKNIEQPGILLKHRRFFGDEFLFNALQQPEKKILFITIMSIHTVNKIKSMDTDKKLKVKELRVLTFKRRKQEDQISKAISLHINEPASAVASQINTAWNKWKELSDNIKPEKILLREYYSIPTMQGFVVEGKYALVELLTYHSNPDERAAILVEKKENPKLFQLFSSSFESLWRENEIEKMHEQIEAVRELS